MADDGKGAGLLALLAKPKDSDPSTEKEPSAEAKKMAVEDLMRGFRNGNEGIVARALESFFDACQAGDYDDDTDEDDATEEM